MKLLRKVSTKEVKRAFVVALLMRSQGGKKQYLKAVSLRVFEHKLTQTKKKVLAMSEEQLDTIISDEWSKRLTAYNGSDWYRAEVKTSEVGVWHRAGGLPLDWTNGSLKDTSEKFKKSLATESRLKNIRARHAVPNMVSTNVARLQKEKYLLPIVISHGTGTKGRSRLKLPLKGDIDDGCMRSIALAVSGAKTLRIYFGMPKKS